MRPLSPKKIGLAIGALGLAIQLVPYGRAHDNPPVRAEPSWNAPETRALARRACFDCHSHETRWPWYSFIAPASWLLTSHVSTGRRHLDFSGWDRPQKHAKDAVEEIREGEMPLFSYLLLHPEARLDEKEKDELMKGLELTFKGRGAK